MKLIKKAELTDRIDDQQCRIMASKAPLVGARYEVWVNGNGMDFHGKGNFPQVEGLMIKQDAPAIFYNTLVRVCRKIEDQKSLAMNLSPPMIRCICSLSMWSQDMATIAGITGLGLENARRITFSLFREGYVTLVQKGDRTLMALTPKGWRAHSDLSSEGLEAELLNRTIGIYSAELADTLKTGRPHI